MEPASEDDVDPAGDRRNACVRTLCLIGEIAN